LGWLEESSFRWSALSLIQHAAIAAILDLVSVDYLTNACVDWSDFLVAIGSHQSLPCSNSPYDKPYLPYTHRQLPTRGLGTPCVALVFQWNLCLTQTFCNHTLDLGMKTQSKRPTDMAFFYRCDRKKYGVFVVPPTASGGIVNPPGLCMSGASSFMLVHYSGTCIRAW
jgi:hypothetical protein